MFRKIQDFKYILSRALKLRSPDSCRESKDKAIQVQGSGAEAPHVVQAAPPLGDAPQPVNLF